MKRWSLGILTILLVFAGIGCASQSTQTAANGSSAVSPKESVPSYEESAVSQPLASNGEESSAPAESTPSSQEETPSEPQEKPPTVQDSSSPSYPQDSLPFFMKEEGTPPMKYSTDITKTRLIRTVEQLEEYERYCRVSLPFKKQYSKEYFETNCLLLFYEDNNTHTLEKMQVSETNLLLQWKTVESKTDETYYKVFPIEIYQRLDEVTEIHMVTRYYTPDGKFDIEDIYKIEAFWHLIKEDCDEE